MDDLQRSTRKFLEDLQKRIRRFAANEPWKKTHFWCALSIGVLSLLWVAVFLWNQPQADLEQGSRCDRAELLAKVASLEGQLRALEKEMEKKKMESDSQLDAISQTLRKTKLTLEKASKGKEGLQAQLAAANQSLGQTEQLWTSCKTQLESMKGKTTSLEEEKNKLRQEAQRLREEIDKLRRQLSSRERELENARRENYDQRWVQNEMLEKWQNNQHPKVAVDISESAWIIIAVVLFLLACCHCLCQRPTTRPPGF